MEMCDYSIQFAGRRQKMAAYWALIGIYIIWKDCMKKIWEADPLVCPRCHAEMKIISFITQSQPDVIRRILTHLGLWEEQRRPPPSKRQLPVESITADPFDDGWPGNEEKGVVAD
jgi:hypothetical protein